jgi:hypothetical protein
MQMTKYPVRNLSFEHSGVFRHSSFVLRHWILAFVSAKRSYY